MGWSDPKKGKAEFKDGNILAVLSYPDMKIPILYGLYYPERKSSSKIKKIDFRSIKGLSFESFPEDKLGWFNFGIQLLNSSISWFIWSRISWFFGLIIVIHLVIFKQVKVL